MKRTDQKRATGNRSLWAMAIALLFSLAVLSCSKTETGTITNVYQPLVSGMVNTYISVLFDDGQTAEVVLPVDDAIWNQARQSKGRQVKVKREGEKWLFVRFVDQ
ncbi:hypothetical protein [Tannerella sp.]|uniref:hypothetical protein n=1 Tax=Tannerella sp. TaxID=2382127 RepID=UPI003FA22852